jgi:zinc protease
VLPVSETILDNGLTVLIQESHAAPVVSCWVGYRVGARNEGPGITGASHWVEHMTFKGTEELRPGEIFRLTARHGGSNNGFTSDDCTVYYETLPAAALDLALRVESQRMASALFDAEETERERTVILAEREGSENNPRYLLSERMGEAAFRLHPYRNPVIGHRDDLLSMTRDDLFRHYRSYYAPQNAALVIAGDVEAAEAFEQVRSCFDGIPPGSGTLPDPPEEPAQAEERRVELRKPGAAATMSVAYHTPASDHPDAYPLALLDAVLSGAKATSWSGGGYMGRSARLYRALVEPRIAVSAGSSFRFSLDPYVFSASLTLQEGADREQAEEVLLRTLEGVAATPPTAEELSRTLRQVEAQFAYGREGATSQAYALLSFQLLGHWSNLPRHVDRLRAVTADDVARVAAAYLRPENRTVGWYVPE